MGGQVSKKQETPLRSDATGNPVPIPGAVWLLAFGVVVLAGLRDSNS